MFQDIIICWDYGIIKVNEHDNNNIKQISSNNSQRKNIARGGLLQRHGHVTYVKILQEGACYKSMDMLLGIDII
jgi:hypothetical protein